MKNTLRTTHVLALIASLGPLLPTLLACHVSHPTGYEELVESAPEERLVATPGVMYGAAPRSWDLSDGRQIEVVLEDARVAHGLGFYRAHFAFDVNLEGHESTTSIRCETDPSGPEVPESRFGCWTGAGPEFEYYAAPGEGCAAKDLATVATLARPECWQGALRIGAEVYEVSFAHLRRQGWVVERVSWIDSAGEVVQAADLVGEMQIELHRSAALSQASRDALTLHAIALHQWLHVSEPD